MKYINCAVLIQTKNYRVSDILYIKDAVLRLHFEDH